MQRAKRIVVYQLLFTNVALMGQLAVGQGPIVNVLKPLEEVYLIDFDLKDQFEQAGAGLVSDFGDSGGDPATVSRSA